MNVLGKIGCDVLFLPPYSPQFAPIELLFGQIKHHVSKRITSSRMSVSRDELTQHIRHFFDEFGAFEGVKLWRHSV